MDRLGRMARGGWLALGLLAAVKLGVAALLLWALLAPPAAAQRRAADAIPDRTKRSAEPQAVGGGSGLVVGGISVDERGKTDIEARLNGWRAAQRLAWPALWARMSGMTEGSAPRLPDSTLDGMVSAIEVEQEQLGGNRYIARLAVVFDRVRASAFLGQFAGLASSPPYLVIPVLQDAGARFGHEPDTPWLAAWARLRAGESPIDYIRIVPTPGDTIMLSAWVTERRDVRFWQMLVDRYAVADVMMPELILERSFADGPVSALLIARFGPTARELGRVQLSNRAGNLAGLMDEAVRQADRLYVTALRAGNLLPEPKLTAVDTPAQIPDSAPGIGDPGGLSGAATMQVRVASPDDATLVAIEQALRGVPGIMAVRTTSYVLGGMSTLELRTSLAPDQLALMLDASGLRLDRDAAGMLVRQRRPDEAPLTPAPEPAPAPAQTVPEPQP